MKALLVFLLFRWQLITGAQVYYSEDGSSGKSFVPLPPEPSKRKVEPDKQSIFVSPPKVPGKSAPLINLNEDPCVPNPCQNGGMCKKDLEARKGEFHCACPLVYRGKFCHQDMLKCETLNCKEIIDCVASPSGGFCVCTGNDPGRLCRMDIGRSTQWDQIKMVVPERTIDEAVIALISICVLFVVTGVVIGVHCHRVNARRSAARARYKDALKRGFIPEPPPDWCDISNDLIMRALFCKKDLSIDKYLSKKSLSKLAIKQQEEALKEMLSQTNLPGKELLYQTNLPGGIRPPLTDMMNEVNEQDDDLPIVPPIEDDLPIAPPIDDDLSTVPPIDPELLENRSAHARSRSLEDARRAASLLDARIRYSRNRYPRGNINYVVRNALASQQRRNRFEVSNSYPMRKQLYNKSNHKSDSNESDEDSESLEESETTETTESEGSEDSESESIITSQLIDSEIKKRRTSVRPVPTERRFISKEVHANCSSHAKMRNCSQSVEDTRRLPSMIGNRTLAREQPLPVRPNARYPDNKFQQRKEYNLSFNANIRPRRQTRNSEHMTQTNKRDFENLTLNKRRYDNREATGKEIVKPLRSPKTCQKSLSNGTSFTKRLNDHRASMFSSHRRTLSDEKVLIEASGSMQNEAPQWDHKLASRILTPGTAKPLPINGDNNFRYRNINTNTNTDENDDHTANTPRYNDYAEFYGTQKQNLLHSSYKYPSYNTANNCNICNSLNAPDYGYLIDPSPEWDNFDKGDWYSNRNPQINSKIIDCVADGDVIFNTSEHDPKNEQKKQTHASITDGKTYLGNALLFNYMHENKSDLLDPFSEQNLNNCDPDQGLQIIADTEAKSKRIGSEFYGIFSTTVTIPVSSTKSEDNSENRSGFGDASEHPTMYCYDNDILESEVEKTKPPEEDLSSDRMYLRSFEKDGQKLYYVDSDQFEKNVNNVQFDGMISEQNGIENNAGLQQCTPILPSNFQHSLNNEVTPSTNVGSAELTGISEHDVTVVERKNV